MSNLKPRTEQAFQCEENDGDFLHAEFDRQEKTVQVWVEIEGFLSEETETSVAIYLGVSQMRNLYEFLGGVLGLPEVVEELEYLDLLEAGRIAAGGE